MFLPRTYLNIIHAKYLITTCNYSSKASFNVVVIVWKTHVFCVCFNKYLLDFLDKQDKESMIDDLLAAGMNFTLDSTSISQHGLEITEKLVGLCGNPVFKKAPLLLNRVLERCPNTLLAEDKVNLLAAA